MTAVRAELLWLIPVLPLLGAIINGLLALAGARTGHGAASNDKLAS